MCTAVEICNFLRITGLTNATFKPSNVQQRTELHFMGTLHRSDHGAMKAEFKIRTTDTEIELMRLTATCTQMAHRRNQDISREL